MATTFSNTAMVSDTVSVTGLSTLVNTGITAPSTLIDNTPSGPRSISYLRGRLRLSFSGALTAGASQPYVLVSRLVAADGTNLSNPPGASAASSPANTPGQTVQLVASGSFQILDFDPFDLDPIQCAFQVYNSAGVNFSGTATLTLYRWNIQGA